MHPSKSQPGPGLFIVDRLLKRSGWIFILLALLAGCAYYLLASQTNDERASAAEINLAGRRRMLSQRISLLASQLQQNPRQADMADLADNTREMADIHRTLLEGTPDRRIRPLPESLRAASLAPDGPHAQIEHFLQLADSLRALPASSEVYRNTLAQIVNLGRGEVLAATDSQVDDYQRLSEAKSDALHWQLWLIFIAGLALLAYSALRVLRPLIMQVRSALTELESSEAALRHAMAENRLILDTTDDGMFGVDQAGRIRFINPAAAQLLGVRAEQIAGQAHHPAILASSEGARFVPASSEANDRKWRLADSAVSRVTNIRNLPSNTRSSPARTAWGPSSHFATSAHGRPSRNASSACACVWSMRSRRWTMPSPCSTPTIGSASTTCVSPSFSPFPANMARSACVSPISSAAWHSRVCMPSRRRIWMPGWPSA
jgi:PAS domain-containing protein